MRCTFCLRNVRATRPTPIYAFVHWTTRGKHHQWKLATGLTVLPKQWSQTRRRVKRGVAGEALTNGRLGELEASIHRVFIDLEAAGADLTPEAVRQRYDHIVGRLPRTEAPGLFDTYERFIEDNTTFTAGTRRIHRSALRAFRTFVEASGKGITFDQLDIPLWEQFIRYLLTVRKITNESAWAVVKSVKAFVAAAHDRGLHKNDSYRKATKRRLLPRGDSSDHPYLTYEELERVRLHDFAGNDRLARVRDLFVFLTYTGMRFNDSQQIEPHHRHGSTLKFTTGKNRKSVTVPLHAVASIILERYGGQLPHISNQRANDYLSEVLEAAEITESVHIVRFRGTERLEQTKRKCDIMGMHSAKRTFVTLGLLRGASAEALAKVTGNTAATLRTYDVRTVEDAIEEVRGTWVDVKHD